MRKEFSELCTPAKIYFAIAVIASIFALFNGVTLMMVFMKLLFAFVWTFLLGWLCKKGFKTLSWFLVLLPYIIIALAMFGLYQVTHEQRQMMRSIQLQGAYGQEAFCTAYPSDDNKCMSRDNSGKCLKWLAKS